MLIGSRDFTDGRTRQVILDSDHRQYVLDDDGEPIYGTWLPPDDYDEPIILRV
jgi:hypothetical protein